MHGVMSSLLSLSLVLSLPLAPSSCFLNVLRLRLGTFADVLIHYTKLQQHFIVDTLHRPSPSARRDREHIVGGSGRGGEVRGQSVRCVHPGHRARCMGTVCTVHGVHGVPRCASVGHGPGGGGRGGGARSRPERTRNTDTDTDTPALTDTQTRNTG